MASASGDDQVRLISHVSDESTALELRNGLELLGVRFEDDPGEGAKRTVVLMSRAALNDERWRAEVERSGESRLVPVALERVQDEKIPVSISPVNWVLLEGSSLPEVITKVHAGLTGDPERYRIFKTVAGEAALWIARDRNEEYLQTDPSRVRRYRDYLLESQGDILARPTEEITEFIAASGARTRKLGFRKWRKRMVRVAVVAIAAVLVMAVIKEARKDVHANRVALSTVGDTNWYSPEWGGAMSAEVISAGQAETRVLGVSTMLSFLSEPWTEGVLGSQLDFPVGSATWLADSGLIAVGGAGKVAIMDTSNGELVSQIRLTDSQQYTAVGSSRDGSRVVAGVDGKLWSLRAEDLEARQIGTAEGEVGEVIVDERARAAVADVEGELVVADLDGGGQHPVKDVGDVLALGRDRRGSVLALVRSEDGRWLSLLVPVSGKTISSVRRAAYEFEQGAIDMDGTRIAVTGTDRQVEVGGTDLNLRPTGIPVPDQVRTFTFLRPNTMAIGDGQYGLRGVGLSSGIWSNEFCAGSLPTVREVVPDPDGDALLCISGLRASLWNLSDFLPSRVPPPAVALGGARSARLSSICGWQESCAAGDRSREVGIEVNFVPYKQGMSLLRIRYRLPGGRPGASVPVDSLGALPQDRWSKVMINPNVPTLLASTEDGRVISFDITPEKAHSTILWTAPKGAGVDQMGWMKGSEDRLVVKTASGDWYTPRGCSGCLLGDIQANLAERAAERRTLCVVDGNREVFDLSKETAEAVNLNVCESDPPELGPIE